TREEPLRPLGVIGCLMTGFDIVSRRLWLIALPVLLDMFLWLGPRLSVSPLLRGLVAFLRTQPAPDSTTARQVMEATRYLEQVSAHINLLALLSRLPLLNVPSLLAWRMPASPLGEPQEVLVTGLLSLASWGILLIPTGLVLGFLYLNGLARHIRGTRSSDEQKPASDEAEGTEQATVEREGAWRFIRVLLFAAGLLAAGAIITPPWLLVVGTVEALVPGMGFWLLIFSMGLAGYLGLHLLFVVPGVMVGGRGLWQATWESVGLTHTQLFPMMGLILLAAVIYGGLSYVWLLPSTDSWALLVGIVGNGCIATGLTAAGFVFYQERIRQLTAAIQAAAKTRME
ncbi:MAG: hypothetical protein U9R15_14200, partial [Chloroflexota bacterium]|nr:hypothetical protein [Chloroflexota bacterium]